MSLIDFAVAAVGVPASARLTKEAGRLHAEADAQWLFFLAAALVLIGVVVWTAMRLLRRGDDLLLLMVATINLPQFDPGNAPPEPTWKIAYGLYGVTCAVAAVWIYVRLVRRTDELERRITYEALAFAFGATLVLVIACALLEDLLPPMRAVWAFPVMLLLWFVGWTVSASRYR